MFPDELMLRGALFSECRQYRYYLKRMWDPEKPEILFIGLNPSTANELEDDATIRRVIAISRKLGYGTAYMMNCFPFVSTDPRKLVNTGGLHANDDWLQRIARDCKTVVFCWGNFKIVRDCKRDERMIELFPDAMALHINANGSPKHPLYCRTDSQLVRFARSKSHA
jgi:hypothetical protein